MDKIILEFMEIFETVKGGEFIRADKFGRGRGGRQHDPWSSYKKPLKSPENR